MPGGRVRLTPGQGWKAGTGCAGVALLSPRFILSLAGGCHCVPGAGLCTFRSVSDLGATGGEGGRTLRMAGRGCRCLWAICGSLSLQKSTDEIRRRLSESRFTCPTELCVCPIAQEGHPGPRERVAARRSREAGPGVGLGRPPSPPRPPHRVLVHGSWDQDPEPPEPEPEGEKAGVGDVCSRGRGGAGPPREEPLGAGVGPGAETESPGCDLQGGRGPGVGSWPRLLGAALG